MWNQAWQAAGYYALASISAERGSLPLALEQVELSLDADGNNLKARALKAALLRRLGRTDEARALVEYSLAQDPLDFRMMAERVLLGQENKEFRAYLDALEGDVQTLLDVSFDLAWSGLRDDAFFLLQACSSETGFEYPMLAYTLAWLAAMLGKEKEASQFLDAAEAASPRYCFPARIEEMIVLEDCLRRRPASARASYYLGNLYYDKRRYEEAIRCWRNAVELDSKFSIPFRNLGIAEFNVLHNAEAAERMYARAFEADPQDARVLYEWDQLKKRAGSASPQERLRTLREHWALVESRDDLMVEYITLLNQCGQWQAALDLLSARQFCPWEGGEGLVSAQYVHAHRELGLAALNAGNARAALEHFEAARHYPHNLGEGKHLLTLERDLDYFSGLGARKLGDTELAQRYFNAAAAPLACPGMHSYFQALALRELGNENASRAVLQELAELAAKQMETEPETDYFATSLPNLLLFDDDLRKRNHLESLLLSALASDGLGDTEASVRLLQQVLDADPNRAFATDMLGWFKQRNHAALDQTEERAAR